MWNGRGGMFMLHNCFGDSAESNQVAGPMYLGPIQDPTFAARVLKSIEGQQKDYGTWQRMNGMLTMAREVSSPVSLMQSRALTTST